jgi:Ni/Fe-hydrogenase subunit HybB-like protein
MGGDNPFFEEAKASGDTNDMIDRVYSMFQHHPVYTCMAIGTFILSMLIYVFLQREYVHITTNPEI